MPASLKLLLTVPFLALAGACAPTTSSEVQSLERVTGDDLDGDCEVPGSTEADGNQSPC